jgi:hypothetical protein
LDWWLIATGPAIGVFAGLWWTERLKRKSAQREADYWRQDATAQRWKAMWGEGVTNHAE